MSIAVERTKNIYYDAVAAALVSDGLIVARLQLRLLVFDEERDGVLQWIG